MKYTIATILLSILGICVLGASELHAQRGRQRTALIKVTVSTMSQQQLLVARRECEPLTEDAILAMGYCTEVQRILDEQPLQIVIRPRPFVFF